MAQIPITGSGAAQISQLQAGAPPARTGVTSGARIQVRQGTSDGPMQSVAASVRRFLLRFLEMQLPMVLGAAVCYLLLRLIPASSSFATVYHPGTYLYTAGDLLFLTVPVVASMVFRGHGWRHSLEMAVALLAPVAAIIVLGELAGYAYRPWLITAGYPAMSLGMLVYMLYRSYEHAHSAHEHVSQGTAANTTSGAG
jgi:hypothetical protein